MIQCFEPDLSRVDIFGNGDELAQILGKDRDQKGQRVRSYPETEFIYYASLTNPVLVTDKHKISLLDPIKRDTVDALYSRDIKITHYNNTSLRFDERKYVDVWGPSIDTLLFCRGLNKIDLDRVYNAIEIGCGSGFITKHVINIANNLKQITAIDLNAYSELCVNDNIDDKRLVSVTGNAVNYISGKKFDLIICNPPYIPRPDSIDDNPYEGVGLLSHLIININRLLTPDGMIVTNISSLCKKIADKAIKISGAKTETLDTMEVPLKVFNVINNPGWIKYLETRGLKNESKNGYNLWQTISIKKITVA